MGRGPAIEDVQIIEEVIKMEENMSARDYLLGLINKRQNNSNYSGAENSAYQQICNWINQWKQLINNNCNLVIQIEAQKSGSRAKGTALKGKSDIDIFVSITDFDNTNTTKEYYDHNLWSNKRQGLMQTNIQKHIDLVRDSGLQNEIMCVKIWRNCHKLELPSIYIEILAVDLLNENRGSLDQNVCTIIQELRDTVQSRRVIDPANSNNNISDSLTNAEKQLIAKTAKDSLNQEYWSSIIW